MVGSRSESSFKLAENTICRFDFQFGDPELFDKKDIDLSGESYDIKKEALLALSVLGFNKSKSEKIVSKIYFENKEIELQELIKQSLNKL